jgi:hypothetical protein
MAAAAVDHRFHSLVNINDHEAIISDNPEKIYAEYDLLRAQCPVAHTDRYNGFWLLTKYVRNPGLTWNYTY